VDSRGLSINFVRHLTHSLRTNLPWLACFCFFLYDCITLLRNCWLPILHATNRWYLHARPAKEPDRKGLFPWLSTLSACRSPRSANPSHLTPLLGFHQQFPQLPCSLFLLGSTLTTPPSPCLQPSAWLHRRGEWLSFLPPSRHQHPSGLPCVHWQHQS